jgi:hypothetical protein
MVIASTEFQPINLDINDEVMFIENFTDYSG